MQFTPVNKLRIKPELTRNSLTGILLLSLAYFMAGQIGLQLQSAQTGITPFWPASGIALAAFILYGAHLWPAIFIAMGAIAYTHGIPQGVAMVSAAGSVLEAIIPLSIAYSYGFNGVLNSLRQLLMLIFISWVGPVISATIGTFIFFYFNNETLIPAYNIFLVWWLGNSFGMLLFSAIVLMIADCIRQRNYPRLNNPWLLITSIISGFIGFIAFQDVQSIQSPLSLNLLIPLLIISSLYLGYVGTLLPVFIVCVILLITSNNFPSEVLNHYPPGMLYLNITELWVVTMTGLLVGISRIEGIESLKHRWLSTHDGLTRLKNRRYLENFLQKMFNGLRQGDHDSCLLFIDLNRFKQINDTEGHLTGDACLKHVAMQLKSTTRASDSVVRWGGDEFIVVIPDCSAEKGMKVARSIQQQLNAHPFHYLDRCYSISASIGVTGIRHDDTTDSLLNRVDKACYQAKNCENNIHLAE